MKTLRIFLTLILLHTFSQAYAIFGYDSDIDDEYIYAGAAGLNDDSNLSASLIYNLSNGNYSQEIKLFGLPNVDMDLDDVDLDEDQSRKELFAIKFKNGEYVYTIATITDDFIETFFVLIPYSVLKIDLAKCFILTGSERVRLQSIEKVYDIIHGPKHEWKQLTVGEVLKMYSTDTVADMYLDGKSIFDMVPCAKNLDTRRLFRDFMQELNTAKISIPTAGPSDTHPNTSTTDQTKTVYQLPATITPYDVITKPFGLLIEKPFTDTKIKNALNACNIKYTRSKDNSLVCTNIPFTLNGKKPTHWKFTPSNTAGIPLQVFNFIYPQTVWNHEQAISFARNMVDELRTKGYEFKDYSRELGADYAQVSIINVQSGKYRLDVMVRSVTVKNKTSHIVTIGTMAVK